MKLKLGGIVETSIVNGEGIRTVIYSTGCSHGCKGCHNSHLLDCNSGTDLEISEIEKILSKSSKLTNKKVTFSGGDPFFQAEGFSTLAKKLKDKGYDIWCYTGYTIEQILESKDKNFSNLLQNIDTLVDGKFEASLTKKAPKYAGSSNQRIIKVKEYIKN